MGLEDIALRVPEKISAIFGDQTFHVEGRYFKGLIDVALSFDDPTSVLDHEAIHALRDLDLFTETEWAILERKSRKEWMKNYHIAKNYVEFSEQIQVEEGVAHAAQDWAKGGTAMQSKPNSVSTPMPSPGQKPVKFATSEMLTASEIEQLRRDKKETSDFARKAFAHLPKIAPSSSAKT